MDDLTRRALTGLARFQIALAAMIFLPAWSLTYWQGWLYWFLFGAACTGTTLYFVRNDPALVARRMEAGPTAEREPTQKIILWFASAALIATYVVSALDHRFGWSLVAPGTSLTGDALMLIGFYGIFVTFKENSFAAATVRAESDQRVITSGPYALMRHPMYTSALIMFIGTPLALGSWWGLLPVAALAAAIVWRLLDEERYLARNLAGYADYQRSVRTRLVPGVW
jgi:protein-S-isoprenylcysteine O-methyltransferase Ste14